MADEKLTELDALSLPPTGDDLAYVVNDPSGAAASKKVSLADLLAEPILVENLGTNWNKYALGAGLFRIVRKLTHTQIKTVLPYASALDIVPAPGSNKIIQPVSGLLYFDWTADYSNFNAAAILNLDMQSNLGLNSLFEDGDNNVSLFFANGQDTAAVFTPAQGLYVSAGQNQAVVAVDASVHVNKALRYVLNNGMTGDLHDGHADNVLIVTVDYSIITAI